MDWTKTRRSRTIHISDIVTNDEDVVSALSIISGTVASYNSHEDNTAFIVIQPEAGPNVKYVFEKGDLLPELRRTIKDNYASGKPIWIDFGQEIGYGIGRFSLVYGDGIPLPDKYKLGCQ